MSVSIFMIFTDIDVILLLVSTNSSLRFFSKFLPEIFLFLGFGIFSHLFLVTVFHYVLWSSLLSFISWTFYKDPYLIYFYNSSYSLPMTSCISKWFLMMSLKTEFLKLDCQKLVSHSRASFLFLRPYNPTMFFSLGFFCVFFCILVSNHKKHILLINWLQIELDQEIPQPLFHTHQWLKATVLLLLCMRPV